MLPYCHQFYTLFIAVSSLTLVPLTILHINPLPGPINFDLASDRLRGLEHDGNFLHYHGNRYFFSIDSAPNIHKSKAILAHHYYVSGVV